MIPSRGLVCAAAAALALVPLACGGDDDDVASSTSAPVDTTTSAAASEDEFADYIGLSVEEAGAKAEADNRVWRVVEEDGESLPVTMDFNETRLNFAVEDGTVVRVTTG